MKRRTRHKTICMVAYTDYVIDARVARAAETAVKHGYSVDLITPRNSMEKSEEIIKGVRLIRINQSHYDGPGRLRYVFAYAGFLVRCFFLISWLHAARKYQIVYVHNMPDCLVFSAIVAKCTGSKIILDIHDPTPETYLAKFGNSRKDLLFKFLKAQQKASSTLADMVITVNEPLKKDILVKSRIDANKIHVIPNYPDGEIFRVVDPIQLSGRIRMVFHGTVASRCGFREALSSIAKTRNPEKVSLTIIGRGDYGETLKKLIVDYGLNGIVQHDHMTYPVGELPGILRQYHLGFVPYEQSPVSDYILPSKMLELLALGIPAITINNRVIRHHIDESMYFSYNPSDEASLTNLIDQVVCDPTQIMEKREAILKNRDRFLWANISRTYIDLLNKYSDR